MQHTRTHLTFTFAGVALLTGCSSPGYGSDEMVSGDTTALVAAIDAKREAIERRVDSLTRKSLSTSDLREQIKQKWSKIDFYVDGNQVVRVKTYPHSGVSTRTEEFYFDGGQLMYAYIQDHGSEAHERGGPRTEGKEYYYSQGKFVTEKNRTGEAERTIRHSDEERLEQEAVEYLALYAQQLKG